MQDGSDYLGLQLVKVQDTVPIHSAVISQKVALGALAAGRPWLDARMQALRQNRGRMPLLLQHEGHAGPRFRAQHMLAGPLNNMQFIWHLEMAKGEWC